MSRLGRGPLPPELRARIEDGYITREEALELKRAIDELRDKLSVKTQEVLQLRTRVDQLNRRLEAERTKFVIGGEPDRNEKARDDARVYERFISAETMDTIDKRARERASTRFDELRALLGLDR